jgi:hypothetical protein
MAEYGLVLPEHDLTAADFKELARRIGRAAFTPLFLRYYERVITSEATIEEQRRGLADIARWTGVEEDKKTDPNANLPVFNIIFGSSGQGSHSIEAVEVISPPTHEPPPEPTSLPDDLPMLPPDMLTSLAKEMKELANVKNADAAPAGLAPAPAGAGQPPPADAQPQPRRRAKPRERAAPVLQPLPADGGLQLRQEAISSVSLEEDMKALDALLGI